MRANLNWLTDPTIFRVNRLDAHSDHVTYASVCEAASGETSLRQCLDGQWLFHWSNCPANRPADFWQADYDVSSFGHIQVPGHMETQGFGQIQYINKLYPWDGHAELRPPQVDMENNPVGSYVREFDLAEGLRGKRVCISFQGVEQACYVWLNGHFIGYSEDTFTPSDFDLTPYIRETGNRLCVEVYKRSSAAWLEDQDFFRFSGIFRSVYLYAKPSVHIDDVWFKTGLDTDNTTGHLRIRLLLSGNLDHIHVHCSIDGLYDGELLLKEEDGYLMSQELVFDNIRLWDYGCPNLYHITLTVYSNGAEICATTYDIGFRRIEMIDKIMHLNGKRLIISGVNRHEWNANSGRSITLQDMTDAMDIFLANNINAVRTCHYPNRTEWYHMCDKNGIYMMDETNMETHGSWQKDMTVDPSWNVPGSLPEWHDCALDRAQSMFERDKNHVSILFWSCGNEAFAGQAIVDMANYFRTVDPSRLVHYEGVYWPRGVANGTPNSPHWRPEYETVSDMESRMYATPAEVREYLENDPPKPYISCEYMHNMGNSLGGMESYVSMAEEFPLYQGGFIWDYMDQALWYTNVNGQKVLGYGGDFGERQSDYNFSGNGIVTADHKLKPCMQEVRYWHATPEERAHHDSANAAAKASAKMPLHTAATAPLRITHGDGALGVRGAHFEILFSYGQAGPSSLNIRGCEWIYRAPRPTYWRAPTENDAGCGFPQRSAIWSAVDTNQSCSGWEILKETEDEVSIRYSFTAAVLPGLKTDITYTVTKEGMLDVNVHYFGGADRPQLPVFGVRFPTPVPVETVHWMGLSGETYPDRMKGGTFGLHSETPHISPYLVPQECGCHVGTFYTKLVRGNAALTIEKVDHPFAFSALPYMPQQLEAALHVEELPMPTRTVISLFGAVRGVGGIDTWGNDVEPTYHIHSEQDIDLNFRILL